MSWYLLILAGLFEIGWAIGLEYSEGFSKPIPTLGTAIAMIVSLILLSQAVKDLPIGTAYAVPMGRSLTACERSIRLTIMAIAVPSVGIGFENPSEYSSPIAHPISKSPASIRRYHDIVAWLLSGAVYSFGCREQDSDGLGSPAHPTSPARNVGSQRELPVPSRLRLTVVRTARSVVRVVYRRSRRMPRGLTPGLKPTTRDTNH